MSFSSPGFLFVFMPLALLVHFGIPATLRNLWLLVASLAFYSIDGGKITFVLILSIAFNHYAGLAIYRASSPGPRGALLASAVAVNLIPLIYYKYWTFLTGIEQGILPAGISFFTFQGISYVIDIYRREIIPAPRMVDFGMYHSLFPQLIAGPIVRYIEIGDRIQNRRITLADMEAGILRFCLGLGKKIIIADSVGTVADQMFALPHSQLTVAAAWIGALCYTLQIYFDFSGYSDMAIGLGRMLGFRFPENFDTPYRSLSITEFWRRWHMTLSRWFRDYLYIPLGGNRAGPIRTYANLLLVFILCGLWHGASFTFLAWGIYHGALLIAERLARHARAPALPQPLGWSLTILLVILGWVIFRAPTLGDAAAFYAAMTGLGSATSTIDVLTTIGADKIVFFILGAFLAVTPTGWIVAEPSSAHAFARPLQQALALFLLLYSSALIAANGFNPFIYFRF